MKSGALHSRPGKERAEKTGGLLRGALAIGLVVAAIAVVMLTSPTATRQPESSGPAVSKGDYAAPSLDRFLLVSSSDEDGNEDGVNETHVRRYRSPEGDRIFSMTSQDRLWAWSLDTHGDDDKDVERNYVIRDSDCDGRFDERYSMDQQFLLPECLE
jgi:hypothetical protein